jgi:hypothetical protein
LIIIASGSDFTKNTLRTNVSFGSLAELNDTPKAAVRAAGVGAIADAAIHLQQRLSSGKFQEPTSELERQILVVCLDSLPTL